MAVEKKYICDICNSDLHGVGVSVIMNDLAFKKEVKNEHWCRVCFDKIRAYIRHGLPRISEVK